ncbi:unnamed protein product [Brassica oleracea]
MKFTKGKQKIEMKKVGAYAARMVRFSKRKSGLFKKMNEIVSLCNVETSFLVFSDSGKPYTFAYPSLKEAVGQFKNPLRDEPSATINTGPLMNKNIYCFQDSCQLINRIIKRWRYQPEICCHIYRFSVETKVD